MPDADLLAGIMASLKELGMGGAVIGAVLYLGRLYAPHVGTIGEAVASLAANVKALTTAVEVLAGRVDAIEDGVQEVRREIAVIAERVQR